MQFVIEETLNESGTTTVCRAFDPALNRRVLLKILRKQLASDEALRERFIREARACASLRSEHIVQVYGLSEIDGAPAIVMEFVNGKTLKDVIADEKHRTLEFAQKVALHVLRGLLVAHRNGIIHRDIKPGNILVAEDSVVKVTDFGLAHVTHAPTVTMEGMVLGTPAYMSPEQVRGDTVTERTDLFSLGATLLEVLSGERIFEGSTYSECMKKVLSFGIGDIDRYAHGSTPEFTNFLQQLMQPEEAERFSSAQEGLIALGEKPPVGFFRPIIAHAKSDYIPMVIAVVVVGFMVVSGLVRLSNRHDAESTLPSRPSTLPQADSVIDRRDPVSQANKVAIGASSQSIHNNLKTGDAEKDSGRVLFASTPWAKVYVDNALIGETPMARPVTLSTGKHSVMFANPQFDPIVQTVTVKGNNELTLSGDFLANVGYLQCNVVPWAEVFVDEQYKDTTPLNKPIMIPAGKHRVRLKNAAFADHVQEVTISARDTSRLTVTLHP